MKFRINLKQVLAMAAIALMAVGLSGQAMALATGKLLLTSSATEVAKGETFTVQIAEDSGATGVNAVQANLSYPTDKVTVEKVDTSGSAFDIKAEERVDNGKIYIGRGKSGATLTGQQLVGTVTFKVMGDRGSAEVKFATGTALVSAADSKPVYCGTNKVFVNVKTIVATPEPSVSPSPSPTVTPAPTVTPSPTPTPTPVSGVGERDDDLLSEDDIPTLPETGAAAVGGAAGLGALWYSGRMWLLSRRDLKLALQRKQ